MKKKRILLCIVLFIFLTVFLGLQNNLLQVSEYTVFSDKIEEDVTIVQLSDLHNATFGQNQETIISKINEINPDMIFMTGDMIDFRRTNSEKDFQPSLDIVRGLNGVYPIYYITGNHESENQYWEKLNEELLKLNVVVLENESVDFNKNISITGVEDYAFFRPTIFTRTVKRLSNKNDTDKFNILLSHRPHYIDIYEDTSFDCIFSGHAHGGQIRIPIIFPNGMYAPGQGMFPKYTNGLHKLENNSFLLISRGLGNSRFPLRFLNYPQINVLTIKAKN